MRASMTMNFLVRAASRLVIATLLLLVTAVSASAETLMMPKRDAKAGVPVVVWGVSTLPNGTAFTLNYGDATSTSGTVGDRSYIAFPKTYAAAGNYTVTLTVGAESASVVIRVFDPATMTAENVRNLGINMAIEDGLRYLWTSQSDRATNFPATATTQWGSPYNSAQASLVALAFQNHGYRLPIDNSAATGLYQKYVVQRALNFVIGSQSTVTIGTQTAGNPCQGAGPAAEFAATATCTALRDNSYDTFHEAYTTATAALAVAASGALSRTHPAVGTAYTHGKTYGDILQRMANAVVWGQIDSGTGRGGWYYYMANNSSLQLDGSTIGWTMLSLMDAEASGVVVPAFAKTELAIGLNNAHNTNGSLDYLGDGNAASLTYVGIEKGGIPLQGMFLTGQTITAGSKGEATLKYISDRWKSGRLAGDYGWGCQVNLPITGAQHNFGCAYSMFNAFKGLKLMGVTTLPGVTRPAGPGAIPAGDWYADYQDWLVSNQTSPTTTGGGNWSGMLFSCCLTSASSNVAIAELILSPVALVLPDEAKFSTVGLTPATNSALELTTHTVTAHAESTGGTPVPGATVNFVILSGPNAGLTGTGTTGANGKATFTYTDQGPLGSVGVDTIRATIGNLTSNIVEMTWLPRNAAPTAVNDNASTFSGTPVTVTVLSNDTDTDAGQTLTVTGTSGGPVNGGIVVNGDGTITYTPTLGFAGIDMFTYAISDGNGGTASAVVTITVSKRAATVTAGSGTKVYGTADPVLTPSSTGFSWWDSIVVSQTARDAGENVSSYPTHATAAGATLANYNVTYTDGSLVITIASSTTTVTCTPSVTYTGAPFEVCTANVTGANLNAAVTPVAYTDNMNVGTAGASATYAGDANHSASTGTASFAITPAATTTVVTCAPSVTYTGAPFEVCTATVTGANLNAAVTPVTYTANTDVGTAGASATYVPDANHTGSTGTASFAITPAATTTVVTCTPSVMYTSGAHAVCTANVTGAGGLNAAVTPVTYTNNVNVGTAGASATYAGDANHAGSTGTATFAITPAPLTVTANSYTRSYLAANPVLTGTLTGVLGADGISATYSSTGTGSQVPGVYPTVPTLVDANGKLANYTVTSINGTLTITNAVPVCTIAPSISSIWPPNHKMVSITASGASDVDGGPLTYKVVSIFQDEPTNTNGDGNTAIDGAGIGSNTAQVRAERTGDPKNPGNGRVYHITFSVTDSLGLSCEATVKVGVPHDQSGKVQPIDGGPIYNSTVAGPAPAAAAKGRGN